MKEYQDTKHCCYFSKTTKSPEVFVKSNIESHDFTSHPKLSNQLSSYQIIKIRYQIIKIIRLSKFKLGEKIRIKCNLDQRNNSITAHKLLVYLVGKWAGDFLVLLLYKRCLYSLQSLSSACCFLEQLHTVFCCLLMDELELSWWIQ